jgi:hypothetical protein
MAWTPDHTRINGSLGEHKALARAAWRACREAEPLPRAWIDRLWANALEAVAVADQPVIQARMFRRSELLMKLLTDQARWPRTREDVLQPSSPRPKLHGGLRPRWDQLARRGSK